MLTGPRPSPSIGARELLSLHAVAQEVAGDLKVVPGNRWGYFYPDGTPVALAEKILSGQCSAADVGTKMKPKALIYDQSLLADTEAKEYILPSIRASTHFVRLLRMLCMHMLLKCMAVPEAEISKLLLLIVQI